MIKKILIAIDGSDHSSKAVGLGADIAAKYGADVVLLHVLLSQEMAGDVALLAEAEHLIPEPVRRAPTAEAARLGIGDLGSYFEMSESKVTLPRDVLESIGKLILDNSEKTAKEHGAANVVKRIADGKPVDRILELAKSEGADMIVTGARGLSGVKAAFLGSVSQKLSHLSPVTCVTVR